MSNKLFFSRRISQRVMCQKYINTYNAYKHLRILNRNDWMFFVGAQTKPLNMWMNMHSPEWVFYVMNLFAAEGCMSAFCVTHESLNMMGGSWNCEFRLYALAQCSYIHGCRRIVFDRFININQCWPRDVQMCRRLVSMWSTRSNLSHRMRLVLNFGPLTYSGRTNFNHTVVCFPYLCVRNRTRCTSWMQMRTRGILSSLVSHLGQVCVWSGEEYIDDGWPCLCHAFVDTISWFLWSTARTNRPR